MTDTRDHDRITVAIPVHRSGSGNGRWPTGDRAGGGEDPGGDAGQPSRRLMWLNKYLTPHFPLDSKDIYAMFAVRKEVRGIMERKSTMLRFPMKLHERLTRESGERRMNTGKRVGINDVVVDILEGYFSEKDRRAKGKRRK